MCVFFFFFKQKTAYEMRISDWSSDVCSSDLRAANGARVPQLRAAGALRPAVGRTGLAHGRCAPQAPPRRGHRFPPDARVPHRRQPAPDRLERSEEHTSELQSLMRISYAVFCLKKQKNIKHFNLINLISSIK